MAINAIGIQPCTSAGDVHSVDEDKDQRYKMEKTTEVTIKPHTRTLARTRHW